MLRVQISALGEALEPVQIACVNSGEVPQHIQINHKTIPVLLRAVFPKPLQKFSLLLSVVPQPVQVAVLP